MLAVIFAVSLYSRLASFVLVLHALFILWVVFGAYLAWSRPVLRWLHTGEVAAAYDFWRAGSGRHQVPGIIKCFGARPDFLRQVIEFSNTVHFSEGHLSRRHKEMIASHVSYLNRCPY